MSETLSGFCVPHTEEDPHTRVGGRGLSKLLGECIAMAFTVHYY